MRILLIEDSPEDAKLIEWTLEAAGYAPTIERVEDEPGMVAALARDPWDLVICDHTLPRFNSARALQVLRAADPGVGCIIVSGSLGEDAAVAAMRTGADDYVLKDRLDQLSTAVERTLRTGAARRERREAEDRYRRLVELAPEGIVTVDRKGTITSLNPAFERITGFPVADALGHPFHEFVHPEDAAPMTSGLAGAVRLPEPISTEIRLLNRAGLYVVTEMTIAPLVVGQSPSGFLGMFRDITERRAMEKEMRRSEGHLRTLVESAPDGIFTISTEGVIQNLNPAIRSLVGEGTMRVGVHFRDIIHPDDLPRVYDIFSRRLRGEEIEPYEVRLLRSAGGSIEVEVTSSALREGNRIVGSLWIVRDLSRRRSTAKELALREERFRLVTLATQDVVYDWDLQRDEIWWNERAGSMFGAPPPVGVGLDWWKMRLHAEDRDRVINGRERTARERQALWTDEYRFQHADGGWRTLMDMGMYVYSEDGVPIRMIGAMSDISERREAEVQRSRLQAAIQAAALDWTATFDAVPMMILVLDADQRIRRLNRAAREALGAPYRELVDRPLGELPGLPWTAATDLIANARTTGRSAASQVEESPTGRTWSLLAALVSTSDGEQSVLIVRDTTDIVQLQRNLARGRTMSALGALVAGVAHEVRNPLFAISATLENFEALVGKDPKLLTYLDSLKPELQRLTGLMRDLLEYGRPAALQPMLGEVRPVVDAAVARAEVVISARGITLAVEETGVGMAVRHDPDRLLQVVQNLLDNALVHAPEQSVIRIGLGPHQDREEAWYRITIDDEGRGFDPEEITHVFEPFYSRRRGGTGLGLSIVERLVEAHGGTVAVENRDGGGARVIVLLPLTTVPA